ncbi:metal cation transporter, ZIP family [Dictyocaulus viviparus]|uniref:Metal cation transporter, ZIP family n=1 Tax=Dictyocaulus viviparus TaxID=29172 RepID=A0A0D8XTD4_DICVI|nr:metal cation transporter, ZIP family [Dictyocaulus viviparus]
MLESEAVIQSYKMNIIILKAILLGVMVIITVIFGLIPIKLLQFLTTKSGIVENRASFIVSILSCFAGGVFLGVCFLDLLPDAYSSYSNWKAWSKFDSDYPFVSLIFVSGFFIVKIFEEIIGKFCGPESERNERRRHLSTFVSVENDFECRNAEHQQVNKNVDIAKSLTFIIALMFHASLEGFAFGVQRTLPSVASLFCGIIVHKAIVSFSVGMRLFEAHSDRIWLPIVCIVSVALVTPLGGTIGIVLEDPQMLA